MKPKHTTVVRKGRLRPVRDFVSATDTIHMHKEYSNTKERQLFLAFEASASGLGYTDYRVLIGTKDYAAVLKAMCHVDEGVALSAMADELAARLKPRP